MPIIREKSGSAHVCLTDIYVYPRPGQEPAIGIAGHFDPWLFEKLEDLDIECVKASEFGLIHDRIGAADTPTGSPDERQYMAIGARVAWLNLAAQLDVTG